MCSLLQKKLLVIILFLVTTVIHADNNAALSQWVKQTLSETLSIDYTQQQGDSFPVSSNYSYNAWNGMTSFLGEYLNIIQDQQLTLHPVMDGEPQIVKSGTYSGMSYWKVNQNVILPELHLSIFFSLVILARDATNAAPYVIQSMDIQKNPMN